MDQQYAVAESVCVDLVENLQKLNAQFGRMNAQAEQLSVLTSNWLSLMSMPHTSYPPSSAL
jgi:hypothetical protein